MGKRLPLFDHSGKVVLTIEDFQKKIDKELEHVRKLKGNGGWIAFVKLG